MNAVSRGSVDTRAKPLQRHAEWLSFAHTCLHMSVIWHRRGTNKSLLRTRVIQQQQYALLISDLELCLFSTEYVACRCFCFANERRLI